MRARAFYGTTACEAPRFYSKALRWIGNGVLLVGLNARTWLTSPAITTRQGMRIRNWYLGYIIDVASKKIVRVLSESELRSQYGIGVAKTEVLR